MDDDVLVGRYRRLRTLGSGGMGEVWLAEDLELGRHVAVKRLLVGGATPDPELVERMTREARMVARLNHRSIVTLHDFLKVDGYPFLIMEYVAGESLAERLEREGTLGWGQVAPVVEEIAEALAAAHRAGVLHRDIKPANILLGPDGSAHLADFGIARDEGDARMTRAGELIGTVAYLPPDIARGGAASPASDVWSLGATFFAAIEGLAPFVGGADAHIPALLARLILEDAPAPSRAGPLTGLLTRMLRSEPGERPTAAEVAAEMRALSAEAREVTGAAAQGSAPTLVEVPRPQLPSGTVTLLFSDMESSTLMVRELGELWPEVLDQQRALCREAWSAHRGHELGTEGDSFFVAFATAEDGVAAALAAQRAITTHPWPIGVDVKVRMGLHTGSPQRHGIGYVGLDVHKAARVASAAHGGQVLLSDTTAALGAAVLGSGDRLIDLGEHRLKDIPTRTRLFQLAGAGLPVDFAPIRSQGAPGSLPAATFDIVGRDAELDELELLVRGGTRAITITGPGGTGKTTLGVALARRVAADFFDGVYLVPLAGATTALQMWGAVAQLLDVPADGHVPPGFFDYVGGRRVLLVLDNLEQIPDADAMVRTLLAEAHHVHVVATSRRPLHVPGEVDFAITPLPLAVGDDLTAAATSPAVELFVQHAARARRGFALTADNAPDVVALCAALDGLPLAIELAAARAKLLSPKAILQRVDRALDLASTDRSREDRQRTLRGAVAWSYDLLDAPHQGVLDHLGVFVGGASLSALEAVVPAADLDGADLVDTLFDLVDASLVSVRDDEDGEPRFGLLETVRRFAMDRLTTSGRLDAAVATHARFYYDLARGRLHESYAGAFRSGRELFLRELDNLRAAAERAPTGVLDEESYGDEPVPVAHVVRVLAIAPLLYRRYQDALQWLDLGLARPGSDAVGRAALIAARARVLRLLGRGTETLAEVARARDALAAAPLDAPAGPLVAPTRTLANLCYDAGQLHAAAGDGEAAAAEVATAMALGDGDAELHHQAVDLAFLVAYYADDVDAARAACLELAELDAGAGSELQAATHQNDLADLDLQQGLVDDARRRLAAATEQIIAVGDPDGLIIAALTFGAAVAEADPLLCARVYGAAHHTQLVEGVPNDEHGAAADQEVLDAARAAVDPDAFDAAYAAGAGQALPDLLREMAALPI